MSNNPLNKSSLVDLISGGSSLSRVESKAVLDLILGAVEDQLNAGGKVVLTGIVTMEVVERSGYTAQMSGEPVKVADRKKLKVTPAKKLKASLNTDPITKALEGIDLDF